MTPGPPPRTRQKGGRRGPDSRTGPAHLPWGCSTRWPSRRRQNCHPVPSPAL